MCESIALYSYACQCKCVCDGSGENLLCSWHTFSRFKLPLVLIQQMSGVKILLRVCFCEYVYICFSVCACGGQYFNRISVYVDIHTH